MPTIYEQPARILTGHVSPETAYVVDDYPYGFKLRCTIRYWIDINPKRGARCMTQTSNPKRPGTWNTPKASTYSRFGGALYLADAGHVHFAGMHEYMSGADTVAWMAAYGAGLPDAIAPLARKWRDAKVAYDARKDAALVAAVGG